MSDDVKDSDAPQPEAPDAEAPSEGAEDGDVEDQPTSLKAKLKAKLKWIIIGVVVLVVFGGGAGLYVMGFFTVHKPYEVTLTLPGQPVLYEMPRITVDLTPSTNRARPFIRLLLQTELQGDGAKSAFVENETRIMDIIQSHLRTVTVEELQGKQGTERLRTDILTIINRIIKPERAIAVLYKEILVR